jgi:DNA uptake protein ComE-like DNA-binding protein
MIALLQGALYYLDFHQGDTDEFFFAKDSLAIAFVDSVRQVDQPVNQLRLTPFNPNFLSDYKGYLLGMSPGEMDSLQALRDQGRFVQDAAEFGRVTGVSDSLLSRISPYFSFPDFKNPSRKSNQKTAVFTQLKDLNTVTAEDLQVISGIGPVLSSRIIRFRASLGGFLVKEQLLDVYGLDAEVAQRAMASFSLNELPAIEKVDLNAAGVEELTRLAYFSRRLATGIVRYRQTHGRFDSIEQLTKIEDFPIERIDRIKLYLTL